MNESVYQVILLVLGAVLVGLLFLLSKSNSKAADSVPQPAFALAVEVLSALLKEWATPAAAKTPSSLDDEIIRNALLAVAELQKRLETPPPPVEGPSTASGDPIPAPSVVTQS